MKSSSIRIFVFVCFLTTSTSGFSEDLFTLGTRAYEDGLFAEAADHWLAAAESGHGSAQFNLGILYEQGLGLSQDYAQALRLYTLAAKNGVVDAAFSVANILFVGTETTPRDIEKAVYWYLQAADAGHSGAQFSLGSMFIAGKDVAEDKETGVSWLELAASNHHIEATSLLRRLAEEQQNSVAGDDWLLSQDPALFTVELYSAPTLALIHEFVLALELEGSAVYASSPDRYHLVVGSFITEQAAADAIQQLPVVLRARIPKVYQFETIQAQLRSLDRPAVQSSDVQISQTTLSESKEPYAPPDLHESVSVNDEDWIKSRNPDRYTAVLFSAPDESVARTFAVKTGLEGGAIYKTQDGSFRVLAGLFENLQEAQNAISRLPSELQALSPRPMKFGSIFLDMSTP